MSLRIIVTDPQGEHGTELAVADVFEAVRTEELNGERSLKITTTRELPRGSRLLIQEAGTAKWREWVVLGESSNHAGTYSAIRSYWCVWSLQQDLAGTWVTSMPGTHVPCSASVALAAAIAGTDRWDVGHVTETATGGASMYYFSGWDALGEVTESWGGEVDSRIEVGPLGVTARYVDLYHQMGSASAVRRFDYSRDLAGISRDVEDGHVYCRVLPRGKGEDSGGGSGRRITIEDVNGGIPWLQDDEAAELYKVPVDGGGWEYPTKVIENGDIDDPQALKDWALSVMHDYTRPKVSYAASVVQLEAAGMSSDGIGLGDVVQCVDKGFSDEGLRVEGRIVKLVTNELDPHDVQVTIGHLGMGLTGTFQVLSSSIKTTRQAVEAMNGGSLDTADYLSDLLARLNAQINATGGYTYITEGQGLRTYDVAVSDPLVGTEASSVVELKGGTIRIANSKDSQGNWEWRTVIQSGLIAADAIATDDLMAKRVGNTTQQYAIVGQIGSGTSTVTGLKSYNGGTMDSFIGGANGGTSSAYVQVMGNSSGGMRAVLKATEDDVAISSLPHSGSIADTAQLATAIPGDTSSAYQLIFRSGQQGTGAYEYLAWNPATNTGQINFQVGGYGLRMTGGVLQLYGPNNTVNIASL